MYEVTMPKLSDSMEVGKIIEWRVKPGDTVAAGDVLAEVESDKAAMELECFADGTIAEILHADGEEVPVGHVVAVIAEQGDQAAPAAAPPAEPKPEPAEQEPAATAPAKETPPPAPPPEPAPAPKPAPAPRPAAAAGERVAISPYARKLAAERGIDIAALQGTGPGGRIVAADVEAAAPAEAAARPPMQQRAMAPAAPAPPRPATKAPAAEPLAQVLADKRGIDLATLTGTGTAGRITVDDVLAAVEQVEKECDEHAIPPSADELLPAIEVREGEADVEDAPFRHRTQVRIVSASKHVVPHFYMTRGADVTALLARRAELKKSLGVSVTHLVLRACVQAIKANPKVNRSYDRGKIIAWRGIHVGIAIDAEGGLTVAVLRDAQDLSLADIVERTKALVDKARRGKLSADERRHPSVTVSNLGMFDVEHFQPIINPPSSVTLGVSSALDTPVVRGGKVEAGRVMKLTLSCDHRIVDGVVAAGFLKTLKDLLESPDTLLAAADASHGA